MNNSALLEGDCGNFSEENEFYFESDHVALRSNKDYRNMLKYIVQLETQKIMIIKDIEKLNTIQQHALNNPSEFVNDLKSGNVDFPPEYTITEMPSINWAEYGVMDNPSNPSKDKIYDLEQENSNLLVRGRAFDQSKPQTFNQLWTCEEQKRLEELLVQFPEEEVEMRRWSKIADALGNRTPKQVMSRVQKYFLKLQAAGLPVPGRSRRGVLSKSSNVNRAQRIGKFLQKRSTFFPAQNVPVLMEEVKCEFDQDIEYNEQSQWTPVELMKAVYERRKIEEMSSEPLEIHKGITCCSCKSQNIIGTRWTDGAGSNWCSDCLVEFQPNTKMTPIAFTNPL